MSKTSTAHAPANTTETTPMSLNQVRLVGRLAAEPTVRETKNGTVASIRLATNDTRVPEFHDLVLWGAAADSAPQIFSKGSSVRVEGRLRTRTWTARDGGSRRTTEIVVSRIEPAEVPVD